MSKENEFLKILFVEDSSLDFELAELQIRKDGIEFVSLRIETKEEFLKALNEFIPDIIISDYFLPLFDGMTALKISLEINPLIPFILCTGTLNEETAVGCMKAGATDYVIKENLVRLPFAIKEALKKKSLNADKNAAIIAMQESETKFRNIFDQSPVGKAIMGLDKRFIQCNSSLCKFLGYSEHELIGKTFSEVTYPDDIEIGNKEVQQIVNGEIEFAKIQKRYIRKNGEIVWGENTFSIIRDNNNNPLLVLPVIQDITERKQLEINLMKLRLAVDNSADIVFMTDENGLITYINKAFTNLYGYKEKDIINKVTPRILKSGILNKTDYEKFWNILIDKEVVLSEITNKTKDGRIVTIENSANPILDEREEIIGFLALQRDITERKRLENDLKEREYFFKESQIAGNIGSYKIDFVRGIWDSSDVFDIILGIKKEYVKTTQTWMSLIVHPDELQMLREYFNKEIIRERKKFNKIFRVIPVNDKQIRWIHVLGDSKFNEKGDILSLIGTIQDNTERKQSEEALKSINERFELATNAASISVWEHDLNNHIVNIDDNFNKIYGLQKGNYQIEFKEFIKLIHPDDLNIIKIQTEEAITSDKNISYEFRIIRPDGDIRNIEAFGKIVKDKTYKPIKFIGVNLDITDLKKAQEELIAAKEHAEESDRLKSAFLANMSHEIRTPMNAIVGFSGLLKEPDISQEDKEKYCEIIDISSTNLLNIIEDIIEISKIQSGLLTFKLEEININDFMKLLHNEYTLKSENDQVDIILQTSNLKDELLIYTDNSRLRQVLINLINNALKFTSKGFVEFGYEIVNSPQSTDDGKTQSSDFRPPTSDIRLPTSYLKFHVKDSGIGISAEDRVLIFERFRQAENNSTKTYGGTGLGLAISKNIIEVMGGKIWLESEPGVGSTFNFTLPYLPGKKKNNIKVFEMNNIIPDLCNKKILIVDDLELNYKLFEIFMTKTKAVLLWAKDGLECIEMFKANKDIDLVLMDIQMPGMDGIELTKILKGLRNEIPIIAQTAYAQESDREICHNAGCDDYISKPIIKEELYNLLEKHLCKLTIDN